MSALESVRWWLRGLRILRYPSLVRGLGELQSRWDVIDKIRGHHVALGLRLSSGVIVENWAPHRFSLGERVTIENGTILSWPVDGDAYIEIGANTWIGPYNNLRTARGGRLVIGGHCLISQFCTLITHNHGIERNQLIQSQHVRTDVYDVTIGDDVWIGAGAVLLPGARVGTGAVIAAGSVVNAEVPRYEIWGGVPARKLGERKT